MSAIVVQETWTCNPLIPINLEFFELSLENVENTPFVHFQKACEMLGGYAATARHYGLHRSAVQQWSTNGVPPHRVRMLCRLVDHKVTPEQIRPDIFGVEE